MRIAHWLKRDSNLNLPINARRGRREQSIHFAARFPGVPSWLTGALPAMLPASSRDHTQPLPAVPPACSTILAINRHLIFGAVEKASTRDTLRTMWCGCRTWDSAAGALLCGATNALDQQSAELLDQELAWPHREHATFTIAQQQWATWVQFLRAPIGQNKSANNSRYWLKSRWTFMCIHSSRILHEGKHLLKTYIVGGVFPSNTLDKAPYFSL
jgi:hypothetical protein